MKEADDQRIRFEAFMKSVNLAKVGRRLMFFNEHNAQDGMYTPYVYLLRVLGILAKVRGSMYYPVGEVAKWHSYRQELEAACTLAYMDSLILEGTKS